MVIARAPADEKPVLGYWAIRGVANQIKYELIYLGVDFEEEVYEMGDAPDYDRSCWLSVKDSLGLEFPNIPYLKVGEKTRLTDTRAIMRFIAGKYGPELLGENPAQKGKVEMLCQIISDLKATITMPCYTTGDRVAIQMDKLEKLKPIVAYMGDKKFLVGDNVTYVDFILFELCDFMDFLSEGLLYERNPTLKDYFDRVKALPRLAEYYADDERCRKRPYNNKTAKINN